jgi:hypothetical protein
VTDGAKDHRSAARLDYGEVVTFKHNDEHRRAKTQHLTAGTRITGAAVSAAFATICLCTSLTAVFRIL